MSKSVLVKKEQRTKVTPKKSKVDFSWTKIALQQQAIIHARKKT
jgi:hypothetical protein